VSEAAKILAFAGATRTGSWNKKLLAVAVEGAREAGAEVTVVDLRDYPMPLYDGDMEAAEGLPVNARKLRREMQAHRGFLIAAPEYNSSITGVLKNTIDWASRPDGEESGAINFNGKVVSLLSASPGALGGLRGLVHVRAILGNLGCIVLPEQVAVSRVHEAFDEQGRLRDEKQAEKVSGAGAGLAKFLQRLAP